MCDEIGDVVKLALLRDHRNLNEQFGLTLVGDGFEDAVCR